MKQAYLFGQILGTHSFYLKDGFPIPDEYQSGVRRWNMQKEEDIIAATAVGFLKSAWEQIIRGCRRKRQWSC